MQYICNSTDLNSIFQGTILHSVLFRAECGSCLCFESIMEDLTRNLSELIVASVEVSPVINLHYHAGFDRKAVRVLPLSELRRQALV